MCTHIIQITILFNICVKYVSPTNILKIENKRFFLVIYTERYFWSRDLNSHNNDNINYSSLSDVKILNVNESEERVQGFDYEVEFDKKIWNVCMLLKQVPKILILTQGRSGSSFLGTLMSASGDAYYVFEPFMDVSE